MNIRLKFMVVYNTFCNQIAPKLALEMCKQSSVKTTMSFMCFIANGLGQFLFGGGLLKCLTDKIASNNSVGSNFINQIPNHVKGDIKYDISVP